MNCIDSVPAGELRGKRVIVRSDFNVPVSSTGQASDEYRIKKGWDTIAYLSNISAKVIVLSHIGRESTETLAPVAEAIQKYGPVLYVPDLLGPAAQSAVAAMREGEILLLENLRRDPREVENDEGFAKELASFGDIYVGDAFAAAHRAHASIVGIPKFLPHYAGFLMRDEVRELSVARTPEKPSIAILGGAKFETKAPLINALLASYDHLFITGALANDVFKAKGLPVGRSLISKELPGKDVLENPRALSPIDVTVERLDKQAQVKKPEEVEADDKIVDIGPDSVAALAPYLEEARFILWNGPTGLYEEGYTSYSHAIAEILEQSVTRGSRCVIGGGDTIASIEVSGIDMAKLGFVSTGGGAMLEYMLQGTLPGIDALN